MMITKSCSIRSKKAVLKNVVLSTLKTAARELRISRRLIDSVNVFLIYEDDGMKRPVIDSMGRTQQVMLVNESGLYSLILSSKLPSAKKLKRWVSSTK